MLEWFVVAFISMPNTTDIEIKQMQQIFKSRSACVKYMKDTPEIVNDIMKLNPTNTGMYFQCLDTNEVARYKVKRESI